MRKLLLVMMLMPSMAFGNEIRDFRDSYEGYRYKQDRRERLVIACLATFDNRDRNYNDQWHQELENRAIACADRLMKKLDEVDYGKQEDK